MAKPRKKTDEAPPILADDVLRRMLSTPPQARKNKRRNVKRSK